MKQEAGKKSKKWIALMAALVVLLATVGIVLAFVLKPGEQGGTEAVDSKIYWNVDAEALRDPESGLSLRQPGEDGLYHFRFAVDGEQVELPAVNDKQLVNYMDTLKTLCLTLDADGVIVDVADAKTVHTETARDFYVRSFDGTTLVLNSSIAMTGMEMTLTVPETAGVYDVDPGAELVGAASACGIQDMVTVFSNAEEQVTHVFITQRAVHAEVYWRLDQYYSGGSTTREPDENGVYTIRFAYKGEQVERKSKDKTIVSSIDSITTANAMFGLIFDEEGYIIDWIQPSLALAGIELCNNYNITELSGNTFTATRQMTGTKQGDTVTATIDDNCEIYMVCDGCTEASLVGTRITELQMDDRITCITDVEGKPILMYVIQRQVDSPMYYNLSRQYQSSTKETTRKPDANGYYVFELASQGGTVKVRTKDKAIASRMDSFTNQGMGLKLNGDIVEEVYEPGCVCGWTAGGVGRYVTALSGTIVSLTLTDDGSVANSVIRSDCEIYDITGNYGVKLGSVAELQMYDRITCFKNISGELTHIFILDRYVEGTSLYYNINRRYNSTQKITTRQPDENGYYVFDMICNGKQVSVKTKSKDMASFIDSQNAPIAALKVSGGIVKEAYTAGTAVQYGYKAANYHYVDSVTDGDLKTYYISNGERKAGTAKLSITDKTKIYNVSDGYVSYKGEQTTLKKDDRIQIIAQRGTGEAQVVFVLDRQVDSPLYWHVSRKYNTSKAETSRTTDAEGYYVFDLAVNGKVQQFKTKDKDIATKVDRNTGAFGLLLSGDVIKQVYNTTAVKGVKTLTAGRYDVMAINGSKVTVTRNRPTSSDYGTTLELNFTKDCKVYNVSSYAESFGAATKLELGDRIAAYTNDDGDIVYCYITNENTHKAGHISLCEHCDKEVFWEPYSGEILAADNVHYYLTHDWAKTQITVGSDDEAQNSVIFDLNGHTYSTTGRGFLVYDKLSIVDTVGGGVVVASNKSAGYGGCIMVTGGGELNLYSGTLTVAEDAGIGSNGGILYVARGCVFNMYGGTVTGGQAASDEKMPFGGNISILSATFNLYGGTIDRGSVTGTGRGGNIYMIDGTFNMAGGSITGGTAHRGGNIYLTGKSVMKQTGGTVDSGVAADRGGNIFCDGVDTVIDLSGEAKFVGGVAQGSYGGNICLTQKMTLNISGNALVSGGRAKNNGGNIAINAVPATVNITGGTVTGGVSDKNGGNIVVQGTDGEKTAILNLSGGVISNGTAAANGGNIFVQPYGTVSITGGAITGGIAAEAGSVGLGSINARLLLGGGSITGGQVYINKANTTGISGAPVIDQLVISEGVTVGLDELAQGADITVTAKGAFTGVNENAESYKAYFKPADGTTPITVKDNVLYCGEEASGGEDPGDGDQQPEGELVLDGNNMAQCPVCQENVTWTAINSKTGAYNNTDGSTRHYYLPDDLANTATNINFMSVTNNGKTCLHLNGHSLSFVNRILISSGGTFNVMGTGSVTGGYADGTIYTNGKSSVNLLSGTYANSTADAPAIGLGSIYANVTLGGNATKVALPKGTFTLAEAATADSIAVGATGKLIVAADWTGTAAASFESALVDDMVPEANGAALGDFTGTLTTADSTLVNKDGRLALPEAQKEPVILEGNSIGTAALTMTFPTDGSDHNAVCPACGQEVTWKAITGGKRVLSGNGSHFYLAENGSYTTTNPMIFASTSAYDYDTLCLHLNGKSITGISELFAGPGALNIMGEGTITTDCSASSGYANALLRINDASAVVNLYGGTYVNTSATKPLVKYNAAGAVNVYTGVTMTGGQAALTKGSFTLHGGTLNGTVNATGGTVTLGGAAVVQSITVGASGKLTVNTNWTGTAVASFESALVEDMIPEANGTCEGAYTGTLTLTDGSMVVGKDGRLLVEAAKFDNSSLEFAQDGKTAYCPACQKDVVWTAVSGNNRMGYFSGKTDLHYYLSGNVDTGSTWNQFTELANSTACLHLNGFDLTCGGRINASGGSTLNIMGEGTVTCNGAFTGKNASTYVVATLHAKGKATINLYGGIYKCTAAGLPVALVEANAEAAVNVYDAAVIDGTADNNGALVKMGSLNILGGTVHGGIKTHSGTVTLGGNATVTGANGELSGNIAISTTSKLVVKAEFKGTASVAFGSTITDNLVPEANGISEDVFEGKLYLEKDGSLIVAEDGKLKVIPAAQS